MHMQITPEEIQKLGERQTVEFKKSLSLQKEAMEALCGMINTDNGTGIVLFGVAPDGSIVGIEPGNLDSAQKSLAQTVRQKFDPPIICSIEIVECAGKSLVLLKADRAANVSYHEYDGRAYIREGSSKRQLSFNEKQHLSKKRNRGQHNGPWRCSRCGSFVGMLSSIVITDEGIKKSYDCPCGGEFWPAI
jgi:predicted HTH transcriptional regulator